MDAIQQVGLPVLGIVAAAALTFYAVSFNEIREKSLKDMEESEDSENGRFTSSLSSRKRRAIRKAEKQNKP